MPILELRPLPILELRLFGPFTIVCAGQELSRLRSRSTYWLLALLAMHQGREVSRAWLASVLWPESSQALYNLRRVLSHLRRELGAGASRIQSPTAQTLCLAREGVWVDTIEFDEAVRRGDREALEFALSLVTGPFLRDCPEEWANDARVVFQERYVAVLERLGALDTQASDPAAVILRLRRLIALDPLREDHHRRLMEALALSGNTASAVKVYQDLRLRLRRQLGTEPDPQTTQICEAIRRRAQKRSLPPTSG